MSSWSCGFISFFFSGRLTLTGDAARFFEQYGRMG
jgi:hypothetical protein